MRIKEIILRAQTLMGNEETINWLIAENEALANKQPINLLLFGKKKELRKLHQLLSELEYGLIG